MSAVIADPADAGDAVPPKRGKKKLLIMAAAGLALALVLAGGAVVVLKKRAAAHAALAEVEDGGVAEGRTAARIDPKNPPTYLPLDPFVVNLADRDVDRYAQIGITFELENGAAVELMRSYMPSIRNAVLMVLANKTSRDLIDRAGKEQLAREIMREAVRPMGIDVPMPVPVTPAPAEGASAAASAPKAAASAAMAASQAKAKAKHLVVAVRNPIQHVHFSSFIIQ
ncbi:MAG: flagellar basal body-associated FliL family protein [Caldimonas sp.]